MTKILTLDGVSGTGKTSVAVKLANICGYDLLLSGLLYRLVAHFKLRPQDVLVRDVKMVTISGKVELFYKGVACYDSLMQPDVAELASVIAKDGLLRKQLLPLQREFARGSGLIAEGRDMGSVVFPEAEYKVFLTASGHVRAERRAKQLQLSGKNINIDELLELMQKRDDRDSNRSVSPLCCPQDALVVDTSDLAIDEVVQVIIREFALCFSNPE